MQGLTLHFVWSYGNIRDKKERGEFAQFGTLPFEQAHDTQAFYYYLSFVSSYSNIQDKIKRGGELVQFGTALPPKGLHVCLLLLLILSFLLFRFFWVEAQHETRPDKQLAPFFFTETSSSKWSTTLGSWIFQGPTFGMAFLEFCKGWLNFESETEKVKWRLGVNPFSIAFTWKHWNKGCVTLWPCCLH